MMDAAWWTEWTSAHQREFTAILLFGASLGLVSLVSVLTGTMRGAVGPFVAVGRPDSAIIIPRQVISLPPHLQWTSLNLTINVLDSVKRTRLMRLRAPRTTVHSAPRSISTSAVNAEWGQEEMLKRLSDLNGGDLNVIAIPLEMMQRIRDRVDGFWLVEIEIRTPLNPLGILFVHPDPNIRNTSWLLVLPIWFGIFQQMLWR